MRVQFPPDPYLMYLWPTLILEGMGKSRKRCIKCGRTRLVKFFWKNKTRSDGLQNTRSDCKKSYFKDYYTKNKDRHVASVIRRRKATTEEVRSFVFEFLMSHPCVDCGEDDPLALEFDHVRGQKRGGVSVMMSHGYGMRTIKEEISKCEVRCANCHNKKTAKDRRYWIWRRLHEET